MGVASPAALPSLTLLPSRFLAFISGLIYSLGLDLPLILCAKLTGLREFFLVMREKELAIGMSCGDLGMRGKEGVEGRWYWGELV